MYTQRLINPMVSAAALLLNAVGQQMKVDTEAQARHMREFFVHQMKDFAWQLKKTGYRASFIHMAQHLLCALIDEIVLAQPWAKMFHWENRTLSWQFAHTKFANQDFFMILSAASQSSKIHLDLLELGYVCLSLGFQGKYRYMPEKSKELALIADDLYETIRKYRGENSRNLSIRPEIAKQKKRFFKFPSKSVVAITMMILLCVIGWEYHHRLIALNAPFNQAMTRLTENIQAVRVHTNEK
jgi:type VI secretion system protein ImpK